MKPNPPNVPVRKQPPPPPEGFQVETERIDPLEVVAAPQMRSPLDDAERIDLGAPPRAAPRPPEPAPAPAPVKIPPADEPLIDSLIPESLIERLSVKHGLKKPAKADVFLDLGGTAPIRLVVRKPEYEDYVWVLAVLQSKLEKGEDASLIMTEAQRQQVISHYTATRCVISIDDEYVWDLLGLKEQILSVNPRWDGASALQIPDFHLSKMGLYVYQVLRRIHPDALFILAEEIKEAFSESKETKENPTTGA